MLEIGTKSDTFNTVKFYGCAQVHNSIDNSVFFTQDALGDFFWEKKTPLSPHSWETNISHLADAPEANKEKVKEGEVEISA